MTIAQERETVINWNDAEETVSIYTASQPMAHKCNKLGFKLEKTDTIKGEPGSWWFRCPKNCVSLRKLSTSTKRILSVEQRKAIGARLLAGKQAKSRE